MQIKIGDSFVVKNKEILCPYYDSIYNNEILTVSNVKVPKVRKSGKSLYFAIFEAQGIKTKIGHDVRFSISLDLINTKNLKRCKQ